MGLLSEMINIENTYHHNRREYFVDKVQQILFGENSEYIDNFADIEKSPSIDCQKLRDPHIVSAKYLDIILQEVNDTSLTKIFLEVQNFIFAYIHCMERENAMIIPSDIKYLFVRYRCIDIHAEFRSIIIQILSNGIMDPNRSISQKMRELIYVFEKLMKEIVNDLDI